MNLLSKGEILPVYVTASRESGEPITKQPFATPRGMPANPRSEASRHAETALQFRLNPCASNVIDVHHRAGPLPSL